MHNWGDKGSEERVAGLAVDPLESNGIDITLGIEPVLGGGGGRAE